MGQVWNGPASAVRARATGSAPRPGTSYRTRSPAWNTRAALAHPFRQLLKPDIIVSAIAVSVLLLIYYTAVGFAVIYLTTVFGFSVKNANGLGNWNWGFNVIAVILVGIVSDYFRVRKPFMVLGGVLAAVMTVIYLEQAGRSSASWCSSRTCSSRW